MPAETLISPTLRQTFTKNDFCLIASFCKLFKVVILFNSGITSLNYTGIFTPCFIDQYSLSSSSFSNTYLRKEFIADILFAQEAGAILLKFNSIVIFFIFCSLTDLPTCKRNL